MARHKRQDEYLDPSSSACAGAATAYVCRKVAARAGRYAPGIHDSVFRSLLSPTVGDSIDQIAHWFRGASDSLGNYGYRFGARRVAFATDGILRWVDAGDGFRGAVLAAYGPDLNPDAIPSGTTAVGLANDNGLVMADPWPMPGDHLEKPPPETLAVAHRKKNFATVLIYWLGYS